MFSYANYLYKYSWLLLIFLCIQTLRGHAIPFNLKGYSITDSLQSLLHCFSAIKRLLHNEQAPLSGFSALPPPPPSSKHEYFVIIYQLTMWREFLVKITLLPK